MLEIERLRSVVVAKDRLQPLDQIDKDGWDWRFRYFGSSLRLYVVGHLATRGL